MLTEFYAPAVAAALTSPRTLRCMFPSHQRDIDERIKDGERKKVDHSIPKVCRIDMRQRERGEKGLFFFPDLLVLLLHKRYRSPKRKVNPGYRGSSACEDQAGAREGIENGMVEERISDFALPRILVSCVCVMCTSPLA